jgi:dienelactone hydrolase
MFCYSFVPLMVLHVLFIVSFSLPIQAGDPLPNTRPLELTGDITSTMIDGIDKFLLRQIAESAQVRDARWLDWINERSDRNSNAQQIEESIKARRQRLAAILGLRDPRIDSAETLTVSTPISSPPLSTSTARIADQDAFVIHSLRWPVLEGVWGEGLLIEPLGIPIMDVIVVPDADQTPEQAAGAAGIPTQLQFARIAAEAGCRVFVPALINRQVAKRGPPGEAGRAELTSRELVYRPAFELGRHVLGYEIQRVLALVDRLVPTTQVAVDTPASTDSGQSIARPLGIIGYGEGGLIALAAAALDQRIDQVVVSGYFGPREDVWMEPIDRNLFGMLNEFGDAEMAALVYPRPLTIDFAAGPSVSLRTQGGAPGNLRPVPIASMSRELARLFQLIGVEPQPIHQIVDIKETNQLSAISIRQDNATWRTPTSLSGIDKTALAEIYQSNSKNTLTPPQSLSETDIAARQQRLINDLLAHTQTCMYGSAKVRKQYFSKLDARTLGAFEKSIEPYRKAFSEDVIGRFDEPLLSPEPRSRQTWETEQWTGYEVVLDVFPDVFAYGALLLPKNLKANEKRPVVVCQHGLEGRPTDTFLGDHSAYHDFAAKLCERGYIVFAPQNIYIFQDRFRSLQRKANPLGKTLFSVMVPQHQQIVNWLKTLPNVDQQRIAFYGLSYGGKSAMRIPALVTDYCLSICSADFNEWIVKNTSTTHNFSYVWTGEYEIFEFDLANTFNYAEMASLICPRPFMVERGHFDGVGEDEWVGFEYAKVQNLYQAKLGIGDRTEIEWFIGPHTINGKGTFEFLDRHLQWPK